MKAAGIEYQSRGQGPAVILLHGIGGNSSYFTPQLDGLSEHFRVISLSLPGYGGSDPMDPVSFAGLTERLLAFMDALDLPEAHLCGQSIGGMIALETACRAPGRVASLALIATTSAFGGRDDSFKDSFVAARLKPLDDGLTLAQLAQRFVPEITGSIASDAAKEAATATMSVVPEETYRAIIRCLVTFDRREALATLCQPVCLIAGSEDQNAPARTMARMAEKLPNASYHEIQGAGHLVNLEAAPATNAILNAFYESLT